MSVHWNKSYTYYNNGALAERQLNLFQRGLRVLGFYSNTRLARVAQTAIESFYKQGSELNEPLLNLATKAITLRKISGDFSIDKPSDDISLSGKLRRDGSTLFTVYSERTKQQTNIDVLPFLNTGLFINKLDPITGSQEPLNNESYSFIQKLLLNTEKSGYVRLQGSNVGTEDSARAYGFEGTTLLNGLQIQRNNLQMVESEHTVSMNAFFRPNDLV